MTLVTRDASITPREEVGEILIAIPQEATYTGHQYDNSDSVKAQATAGNQL